MCGGFAVLRWTSGGPASPRGASSGAGQQIGSAHRTEVGGRDGDDGRSRHRARRQGVKLCAWRLRNDATGWPVDRSATAADAGHCLHRPPGVQAAYRALDPHRHLRSDGAYHLLTRTVYHELNFGNMSSCQVSAPIACVARRQRATGIRVPTRQGSVELRFGDTHPSGRAMHSCWARSLRSPRTSVRAVGRQCCVEFISPGLGHGS